MSYRVVWDANAESDLKTIWALSDDTDRLAEALFHLDATLATDPYDVGESREGAKRIGFEEDLIYEFLVDDQNRLVIITAIWQRK
jgi:hypothetical protein